MSSSKSPCLMVSHWRMLTSSGTWVRCPSQTAMAPKKLEDKNYSTYTIPIFKATFATQVGFLIINYIFLQRNWTMFNSFASFLALEKSHEYPFLKPFYGEASHSPSNKPSTYVIPSALQLQRLAYFLLTQWSDTLFVKACSGIQDSLRPYWLNARFNDFNALNCQWLSFAFTGFHV